MRISLFGAVGLQLVFGLIFYTFSWLFLARSHSAQDSLLHSDGVGVVAISRTRSKNSGSPV